jgi:hypothetical protein
MEAVTFWFHYLYRWFEYEKDIWKLIKRHQLLSKTLDFLHLVVIRALAVQKILILEYFLFSHSGIEPMNVWSVLLGNDRSL